MPQDRFGSRLGLFISVPEVKKMEAPDGANCALDQPCYAIYASEV